MSEYQYYEFLAVDRPLDAEARAALREISSRAQITANSFTNEYHWGGLKADPLDMLGQFFDLMFYTGFWSMRRFAMRVPARLIDRAAIEAFNIDDELLAIEERGDDLIFDVNINEREFGSGEDDTRWLAALTPLRTAVMSGDLRFFYLLWLMQAGFDDFISDDALEPLPGIAPLDGALAAWADFLEVDPNLVTAAAERGAPMPEPGAAAVDVFLRSLRDDEKLAILRCVYEGDSGPIAADLRRRCRASIGSNTGSEPRRNAGALREAAERAAAVEAERQRQERQAEERRKAEADARAKAARIARLSGRETHAWQQVEASIEQRNRQGYQEAITILGDLREIVAANAFAGRIQTLRLRHSSKRTFIEALDAAGFR